MKSFECFEQYGISDGEVQTNVPGTTEGGTVNDVHFGFLRIELGAYLEPTEHAVHRGRT